MTIYYSPGALGGGCRSRQGGGNQSLLSYNLAGAPGYTGYCPTSACLPPPTKTALSTCDARAALPRSGSSSAAGAREAGQDEEGEGEGAPSTTYAAAYRSDPTHDWGVDPRHEGTFLLLQRDQARAAEAAGPPPPFQGQSTYQAELLQRCGREGGAASGVQSAPTSPAAAALAPPLVQPGWLTTQRANSLALLERARAAPTAAAAAAAASAAGPQPLQRQVRVGSAPPGSNTGTAPTSSSRTSGVSPLAAGGPFSPHFEGVSTYAQSYQPCQQMGAAAQLSPPAQQAQQGAGQPLGSGSSQAGGAAAEGSLVRPPKEDAFLYHLDQHSRGRLPGYTGHRPHHDVSLLPPPPSRETTQGRAAWQAQRALAAAPPALGPPDAHALDSRQGTLSFFSASAGGASSAGSSGSGGGGFVSENGVAEAQRYFEAVRPLEGRMRIPQPPSTNRQGARFAG